MTQAKMLAEDRAKATLTCNLCTATIIETGFNQYLAQHYLGPINPARVLTACTDGEGICVFGRATATDVKLGLKVTELARLWMPDNHNAILSHFVSHSMDLLKQAHPELDAVIAYSAREANHSGGIYRATNFIYLGLASPGGPQALIIDGKTIHTRTVNHRYGHANQDKLREEGHTVTPILRKRKLKYAYPLTRKGRKVLTALAQPYTAALAQMEEK